jgi:hypothetical protein
MSGSGVKKIGGWLGFSTRLTLAAVGCSERQFARHPAVELGAQLGRCDLVRTIDAHETSEVRILRHGLIDASLESEGVTVK